MTTQTPRRTTEASRPAPSVVPTAAPSPTGAAVPSLHSRAGGGAPGALRYGVSAPGVYKQPLGSTSEEVVLSGGNHTAGREWTIEFPAGMELLTSNNRLSRYPKAGVTKALRERGLAEARKLRLPPIGRADIHVTYLPPPRLRRDRHPLASARVEDPDALAPAVKALIDGITSAGVFPSDSRRHVRRVTYELLDGTCPRGQVTLHITEIGGDQ